MMRKQFQYMGHYSKIAEFCTFLEVLYMYND